MIFIKICLWDRQLLTLQNRTVLPLFKQNLFLQQVVGEHQYQVPALFLLASRSCEFKYASSSQHPIIMASRFLWSPGSRARNLALYRCICKIPEPVWHEHKTLFQLCGPIWRNYSKSERTWKLWCSSNSGRPLNEMILPIEPVSYTHLTLPTIA